jgi:hypothetical protein
VRTQGKAGSCDAFAGTKERIAGFAIFQAEFKAEAIELAQRFLKMVGEGECLTRLIYVAPALAPPDAPAGRALGAAGPNLPQDNSAGCPEAFRCPTGD